MLLALLALSGCADHPGEPGVDEDCLPFPVDHNCSIFECWRVQENGVVEYRFEWGWDEEDQTFSHATGPCHSYESCAEKELNAERYACGTPTS